MQRDVRMSRLRNFLLDNLPLESRRKLLENVVYITIPANKYIFREGQDANYICVIQRGKSWHSHPPTDMRFGSFSVKTWSYPILPNLHQNTLHSLR